MAQGFQLAQINVGRLKAPLDAPETRDFADNLDSVNALADGSSGFVWRLVGDGGDATDVSVSDDPLMLINMSVWTDPESLAAFVYRSGHREIMRRRREWFDDIGVFQTLWWVPAGHRPTPEEGLGRLETLKRLGPTAEAFTFRDLFPAPGSDAAPAPILDKCA